MKRPFRGLRVTWKDLSVLCLLPLVLIAPANAAPLDFARGNEQAFLGNNGLEKSSHHPSHIFYAFNDFSRIEGPESLLRDIRPLPLPDTPVPEKEKKPRFWRDSLIMYGAVWMFTFTVNFRGLGSKFSRDASFRKFGHHFVTPPELNDGDPFVTNYIAHPMFGGFTYYVFKQRGHSARKSLYASALQSTLFEYTVEGFIQRPSGMDLLVTPLIGVPVGERAGKWILPLSVSFIAMKYLFRSPL